MALPAACLILLVVWTLVGYAVIPLPIDEFFFAWVRRQWLFEGIALLSAAAAAGLLLSRDFRRLQPASWWRCWMLWLAWAGVTVLLSIDKGTSLRQWLAFASYGLLAYAVSGLVRSERDLKVWVLFLAAVALVAMAEGLIQYTTTFRVTLLLMERMQQQGEVTAQGWGVDVIKDFLIRKRITSFFGWPNLFAGFLLFSIPLVGGVALATRTLAMRIFWFTGTGLLGLCLVLTLSMGGWIAAVLTAGAWLWLTSSNHASRKSGRGLLIALGALGLIAAISVGGFIIAKRARPLIAASVGSRTVYTQGALRILSRLPLQGTGVGTFGLAYQAMKPQEQIEGQHNALHAHNTLMEIGADTGWVGLGLFVWWLATVWLLVLAAMRSASSSAASKIAKGLSMGVLGFFLYSVLEQIFFENVTAPFWWIGLGLLTAAARLNRPDKEQAAGMPRVSTQFVPAFVLSLAVGLFTLALLVADVHALQAVLLNRAGQFSQAEEKFERAQGWDPLNSRFRIEQAERLLQRAPWDVLPDSKQLLGRAEAGFSRATQLSPWLGYAWLRLGVVQWRLGLQRKAIASMEQAVQRNPNSRAALLHLGNMLLFVKRPEEVFPVAAQLRQLEPKRPQGWFLEALAWQQSGQPDKAIAVYRRLLHAFPADAPSWYNLGQLLRQHSDSAGARAAYRRFLQTAPANQKARRAIAQQYLDALP